MNATCVVMQSPLNTVLSCFYTDYKGVKFWNAKRSREHLSCYVSVSLVDVFFSHSHDLCVGQIEVAL